MALDISRKLINFPKQLVFICIRPAIFAAIIKKSEQVNI